MKVNTLPKNWVSVSLDDICDIEMGQSPPSNTYNNHGDGLPFFQGKAEFNDLYPTIKKWCTRPKKIVDKNTILISVRAPVGPTNIAPDRCCIGRGLAGLTPYSGISNRFVLYGLRALENQLISMGAGSTFDAIASSDLRNFKIPLAPVNEQARILQKVEEQISRLDFAISGLTRIKTNLKRYRASVLQAAVEGRLTAEWRKENPPSETGAEFLARLLKERRAKWEENQLKKYAEQGKTPPKNWKEKYPEPVKPDTTGLPELPVGWVWATLEQTVFETTNGFGKREQKTGTPTIVLRLADIAGGEISLRNTRKISATTTDIERYGILAGDLLTIRVNGSPELVGRLIYVNDACQDVLYCDHFIRLRSIDALVAKWARLNGDSKRFRKHIELNKVSSAGQNTISQSSLVPFQLPLPPREEIKEIAGEIASLFTAADTVERTVESALKRASILRQSILKRAFAGRLVPQDPNDEPASMLLERIRAERAEQSATVKPARTKRKRKGDAN